MAAYTGYGGAGDTVRCTTCSTQVRAPSTFDLFLRAFTHGHVKQLLAVGRRLLDWPCTPRCRRAP
ncbi:hypothetical protein [Streptomyces mirabilis]|uniref:hypothetical protein n=1 Tax=Streptomyces mirabilis TaxID=68239 RepID=UPI0036B08552